MKIKNWPTSWPFQGLVRQDWDFSACDAEHLPFCYTYEYAREIPALREAFNLSGHSGTEPWHCCAVRPAAEGDILEVIDAPPGFPRQPYLLCQHTITPNSYAPRDDQAVWPVQYKKGEWVDHTGAGFNKESIYHFSINWWASDNELVRCFRAWVEGQKRPFGPDEKRGGSEAKTYMMALKDLGIYRLSRQRGSITAAYDAWELEQTQTKGRKGLYRDIKDWYDANGRAKSLLTSWLSTTI